MPIYEYKCSQCGNVYEKRQKFSDPADTECNCEKKASVHRMTSAPALVFKGSGWYINDYARAGDKGGKNGSQAEKGGSEAKSSSGSSDSGSSTKSESSTSGSGEKGSGTSNSGSSPSKPSVNP